MQAQELTELAREERRLKNIMRGKAQQVRVQAELIIWC